jgi:hypothetical protein
MENREMYDELILELKKVFDLNVQVRAMFDLILASYLSMETEQPTWIMIIAPPSSGKTELKIVCWAR